MSCRKRRTHWTEKHWSEVKFGLKFSLRLWTQRKLTSPTVFCINNSYTVMLVQAAVKSSCTVAVSSRQFYNVNYVLREIRDIGVPDRVHPGRGTKGLKSGTSRIIRDGWQPCAKGAFFNRNLSCLLCVHAYIQLQRKISQLMKNNFKEN